MRTRWLKILMPVLLAGCLTLAGRAEDAVILSATGSHRQVRRTGTIVDLTGSGITLEVGGGRREQIAPDQIISIETEKVPDQRNADRLFAERKYAEALAGYRSAVDAERRTWMRREILAQMVVCYHRLDQIPQAGDTFSIIVRSDPTTQHFAAIPLSWKPQQSPPELERRASAWMAQKDVPAMALLGASWLMNSAERGTAQDTLRQLATGADAPVAMLAEAQRWRSQIVTATETETVAWQRRIDQFPARLRAGPYFLLGRALARLNQHEAAALALMHIPILYPIQYDLAAEALLLAGQQLQRAGQEVEARSVYRELVDDYSQHPLASAAQQRLGVE